MMPEEPKDSKQAEESEEAEESEASDDAEESEKEFGPDYLNWKPLTPEDFPEGQEYCRDLFFAFRKQIEEDWGPDEEPNALEDDAKAKTG